MTREDEMNPPATPQGDAKIDTIKILIVEDSPNINLLYDRGLPDLVFEKRFATNGKDGLVIYDEWHPEIIVLDVMLPVMTGYSVLKEIRNNMKDQSTMIIMSTSLSGKEDVTSLMKLGIQGYILKPFSVRDIGRRILSCFEKADPPKAESALLIYEKAIDDVMKSSFKAKLVQKPDEDAKLMKVEPDFSAAEFTAVLTIEGFCKVFDADQYGVTVKAENNSLAKMNELLQIPNLYEKIMEKKKVEGFTKEINFFLAASEKHRSGDFTKLDADSQKRIKILNRLLLKLIYPDKIPEIKHG